MLSQNFYTDHTVNNATKIGKLQCIV